ncbi:MAG: hypothetical protein WCH98_01100 [Verrucomicrobiota bacterium]
MNRQNRYDQLDPFTVKVINSEARNLIGTYAFTEADFHDLQQDLHLHVRRRMASHTIPDHEQPAFIRCIVKNYIRDLISERTAGCRDVRKNAWSLNEAPEPDAGSCDQTSMEDVVDCHSLLDRFGMRKADESRMRDLRIDLADAIARMPHKYAPIISALMRHGGNVVAAGRELNLSRKQMAAAMAFIRGFLEGAKIL